MDFFRRILIHSLVIVLLLSCLPVAGLRVHAEQISEETVETEAQTSEETVETEAQISEETVETEAQISEETVETEAQISEETVETEAQISEETVEAEAQVNEETVETEEQRITVSHQTVPSVDLPENEELYAGYLEKLFYGSDAISFFGESARGQLNSVGQGLYDYLKEDLLKVAAGKTASTVFTISGEQFADFGAEISIPASSVNDAFSAFLSQFEIEKVFRALLHDCPYEMYWYDKATGVKEGGTFSSIDSTYTVISMTFQFSVAGNYQPSNYDPANPTFDTAAAQSATAAAANAKAIVSDYAGRTDYQKLSGYKDKICSLVSYDEAAASTGDFSTDVDPWQLVHVFDGDSSTNVVCEGYSKAFQYLCDLSNFNGDVSCYTVTGTMIGGTGAGGHMWNIVNIGGGNYLVDVTNSDSGTIGQYGGLFLVGGVTEDISDGYTFCGATFYYDGSSMSLWGTGTDSILRLAVTDFDPTISGACGDALTWTLNEETNTLTISGTGDMYDYGSEAAPWSHMASRIIAVRVESGVTGIGDMAFAGCEALTSAVLSDTLVSIGDNAFANTGLVDIEIPVSVTIMGDDVFEHCEDLDLHVYCESYGEAYAKENGLTYERLHMAGQWKSTVTKPTCVDQGYTTFTCPVCGDSYKDDYKDATGEHSYQKESVIAPTCVDQGYTVYTCSVCGDSYKGDFKDATGEHSYQKESVIAPTCVDQGYTVYTCSVCGDSYKDDYKDATGEHVYQDDADTTCDVCGYTRTILQTTPVYRLYNPYTQEHLLTGEAEKDILLTAGWSLDGLAWEAPTSGIPVYRLYNPYGDFHFYSTSDSEIASLTPLGWTVDGVVSYSATEETGAPVYRLFNPYAQTNYHIFTASAEERDWLASLGWELEGVAWYAQ